MFGRTYAATASQAERRYYQCRSKDCILTARPAACPSRNVKTEEIKGAVWDHAAGLLADPDRLLAQFDHFAATAEAGSARDQAAEQHLRARLDRTTRADKRLLDAYEAGAITLPELSERRRHLAEERRELERQQQERDRLRQQRIQAQTVRTSLEAFCARIHGRLDEATFADKQAILQLVVERIIVGDGSLEIRHVIPLRPPQPSGNGPDRRTPQLRSDRVHPAALPRGVEQLGDGGFQTLMGVRDHQFHPAQAALPQLAQEACPEGLRFRRPDVHAEHLAPTVAVDADGDDDRHRHDPAGLADLHVGRVEPEIGPVAFDRPVEKRLHPAVDLLAQPAHLALGDAGHAHQCQRHRSVPAGTAIIRSPRGLDEFIHRAGR